MTLRSIRPGLLVTEFRLQELGLITPPESPPLPRAAKPRAGVRTWPSYERCLSDAPANSEGTGPDVSRADFTFCLIAIDWGWTVEEVTAQLLVESEKAKAAGHRYAALTATQASEAIARRN